MPTNPNDAAFAQPILGERENGSQYTYALGGLTKREHFAAMAMAGILANSCFIKQGHILINKQEMGVDKASIMLSDALIAELNK